MCLVRPVRLMWLRTAGENAELKAEHAELRARIMELAERVARAGAADLPQFGEFVDAAEHS